MVVRSQRISLVGGGSVCQIIKQHGTNHAQIEHVSMKRCYINYAQIKIMLNTFYFILLVVQ